jgi:penicillin-binding protein 2
VTRKQREEERTRGRFTRRAVALGVAQLGLLGFLGHRLHKLQVQEGERYATLAEENRLSARLLAPPRGRVLDREGRVVAGNQQNWRALLVAEQTTDVGATLETFARIVPLTDQERRASSARCAAAAASCRHAARVPDLGGDGADRAERARPARHQRGCRHHAHLPEGEHLSHIVGYVAPPSERTWMATRCWSCPASASAAPGWSATTTARCAGAPAPCSSRSTPSAA